MFKLKKLGWYVAAALLLGGGALALRPQPTQASGESFSGTSSYSITGDDKISFSDLQVQGSGNDTLTVNIFVPFGTLAFTSSTGLTFNGASSGSNLNFSGTRSNINTALHTLSYTPSTHSGDRGDFTLQITIGGAPNSLYDPVSHHIYQSIHDAYNWNNAKTAAEAASFDGAPGYLATITSSGEQDIIAKLWSGGWTGGSDSDEEGVWNWVTGPDAGQNFWNGGPSGSAPDGAYANWQETMPDNYTGSNPAGENCLEVYSGSNPKWNDQNCDGGVVGSYLIEYGDADHSFSLPYKNIAIHVAQGRDLTGDSQEDSTQSYVKDFQDLQGNWVAIKLAPFCSYVSSGLASETDQADQDSEFNYPAGLIDFTANCSATFVWIYYYGHTSSDLVLRKYNPTTHEYANLDPLVQFDATINGEAVVEIGYSIADGSALDTDGDGENGQFTDPIGLAVVAPPAPPAPPDDPTPTPPASGGNSSGFGAGILPRTGQELEMYTLAAVAGASLLVFVALSIRRRRAK